MHLECGITILHEMLFSRKCANWKNQERNLYPCVSKSLEYLQSRTQFREFCCQIFKHCGSRCVNVEQILSTVHVFTIPIIYGGSSSLLVWTLGWTGLIPIVITLLGLLLVYFINKVTTQLKMGASVWTDTRLKMIMNLVEGIKSIKLYGWEFPILSKIF